MRTKITTNKVISLFTMILATVVVTYAQPANDLIANATNLVNQPIPYNEANVNFPAATYTNDATIGSGCNASHKAVWYKFTATKVGTVGAAILDPDGATIVFFEGPATGVTSGTQLTYVNQADNPCTMGPLASIQTAVGKTYYIYMRNLIASDIIINISAAILLPPNDLIENAIDLGQGPIPYTESLVNFLGATVTGDGTAGSGCTTIFAGVWYKFTATKVGTINAGIMDPDGATIIFFEGPESGVTIGTQLTYVNQGNNPCSQGPLSSIQTTAGTTYYIYMRNKIVSDVSIDTTNTFKAPDNDLIENAKNIEGETMPYVEENIHFLMATNTNDGGQTDCTTANFPGIWYKVTPQQDGQISAQMSSANENSILIIYESQNPNATTGVQLIWVDQQLNPCSVGNFAIVDAEVGKTYYFFAASVNAYADIVIDTSLVLLSSPDHDIIDFNYYPNPVIDQLNFNAKSSIDNIKIYNLLGQQVLRQNINNNSGSLDISHLSKGMYLAEIISGSAKTTAKILKN